MDGMNTAGYFTAGNVLGGMMGGDVTPFHPSMLLEHGYGGAAVTVSELGTQFAATTTANAMLASFVTARPQQQEEDMDYSFDDDDSYSAASLQQCHGQDAGVRGMAMWSPSSSRTPVYGGWSGASDAAGGFHFPLAAWGGVPSARAKSELSLTLCSKSSVDNAADQCSSVTELPQPRSFAVLVARSRYAAAAQAVLNDFVGGLLDGVASDSGSGGNPSSWSVDASSSAVSSNRLMMASPEDGGDARSGLIKMLQMLDHKYNQCLDEIHSTTAKFNGLIQHDGGGNASICAQFAHRAVADMYRGLRRRIAGEIMAAEARSRPTCWGESSSSATAAGSGGVGPSWESVLIQKHWAMQRARRGERHCWRPHGGLPYRSVAVLKAWMFEHFLKPYPDDHEKNVLAARSGLTRNQVSNWFINARVRIWKPMIEEMYRDLKRSAAGGHAGTEMETQQQLEQSNMLSA
ncbi:hypothetical protein QOZ80_2BG0160330 [Eleusine coracana subsp. coracana]|nr:hypothetical protein QOZ80_2BG0160330 [Eleusine coracana subsp. coracana]